MIREQCPKCKSTNTEPIGYSIIDIVHLCNDCEHEWDTERDYENGDVYAKYLKKQMHDRVNSIRKSHRR